MCAMKLLSDWVLHLDGFDLLVKRGEGIEPSNYVSAAEIAIPVSYRPFLRRYDLHDTRLHPIFINLLNERLEAAELIHCLSGQSRISVGSVLDTITCWPNSLPWVACNGEYHEYLQA